MGQSFFKKHLADDMNTGHRHVSLSPSTQRAAERSVVAYSDKDVVNYFQPLTGLQRWKLAAIRTEKNRGEVWECVGKRVGMTAAWVRQYADETGASLEGFNMEPIKPDDAGVTVVIEGAFPNHEIVRCRVIATEEREIVTVPSIYRPSDTDGHTMVIGECFDAVRNGSRLVWNREMNSCVYFRKG